MLANEKLFDFWCELCLLGEIMKRIRIHLEIIRIIAIVLVIFNHTNIKGFTLFTQTSSLVKSAIYIALSIFCKIAVPLFFMVSGALLLPKTESLSEIFEKRIKRFIVVLIAASLFYYSLYYDVKFNFENLIDFFNRFVTNNIAVPLWYLYAFLGLMIMLPFIRFISKSMDIKLLLYFISIHLLFNTLIPTISFFTKGGQSYLSPVLMTSTNIVYFILGDYFENKIDINDISKKFWIILFATSLLSIFLGSYFTAVDYHSTGKVSQYFHSLYILAPTLFTYLFIKRSTRKYDGKLYNVILALGSTTFGIYLMEQYLRMRLLFIQETLDKYMITIAATTLYIFAVILTGSVITLLIRKIPGFSKYV